MVAIVAATVLGTLIGIGRLSSNWIVKKLATVYVEAVRNIPLALFLTASVLVVVLGVFPQITDAWDLAGLAIISNRGVAVAWYNGSGAGLLLILALGILAWYMAAKWRSRVADRTGALPRSGLWGAGVFVVVLALGWTLLGYSYTLPSIEGRGHRRRHPDRPFVLRTVPGAHDLHREPHRRDRPRIDPGGAAWAGRSR